MTAMDAQLSIKTNKEIVEDLKFFANFEKRSVNYMINKYLEEMIAKEKERLQERIMWNESVMAELEKYQKWEKTYTMDDVFKR